MPDTATMPPVRRPELLVRPLGEEGQHVVKDRRTGEYFRVGPQEAFLLSQLDGKHTAEEICHSFENQFAEPLPQDDLEQFLALARARGFLQPAGDSSLPKTEEPTEELTNPPPRSAPATETHSDSPAQAVPGPQAAPAAVAQSSPVASRSHSWRSILHYRKRLFDPDRLFNWLEPKLRFFWTPGFLFFSLACIAAAAGIAWANAETLVSTFAQAMRWEIVAMALLTLVTATMLHEFAHGLTCKHFGGEVHEIGVLLMFLLPGLYCNVSDSWLFREKSKRLWVTFAGGYFDLFIWALAVFAWRLTLQDSLLNYLCWVVVSVTGFRAFFNFNPFLKLDGYYLLSDLVGIPNLRQRAVNYLQAHTRWLLWGAARPQRERRGRLLLAFGAGSWLVSVLFLTVIIVGITGMLRTYVGTPGYFGGAALGAVAMPLLFQGFSGGEVGNMLRTRQWRTTGWVLSVGGLVASLWFIEVDDRYGAPFQVHPVERAELRAPVAAFLKDVYVDEGDRVSPGGVVVRLEIPDLASRIAQKRAEVREAEAELELLQAGPRSEEIALQQERVQRARKWLDSAKRQLANSEAALQEELAQLDEEIAQAKTEKDFAEASLARSEQLRNQRAMSEHEHQEAEKKYRVAKSLWRQAQSERRAREAAGVIPAEEKVVQYEKELAEAEAAYSVMELGTRVEEVEAARARLDRLGEDLGYLQQLQERLEIRSPVGGVVTTARLREMQGQYFPEGELLCEVEELSELEIEITLAEQDVSRIRSGQSVGIKPRSMPFEMIEARLDRIAPRAVVAESGETQSHVSVYCRVENGEHLNRKLRSNMTGYARIYGDRRPVGDMLFDRATRFLRTEFWW